MCRILGFIGQTSAKLSETLLVAVFFGIIPGCLHGHAINILMLMLLIANIENILKYINENI